MCRSKVLCIFRHTMHAFVILIKKNGRKKKQKGFNLIFAGSIYRFLHCLNSMFLILKSKWHLHYTARMSIVCKLSVTRLCMCWFFHFLTIFKLIRCLKISLCTNTCSSNEIFNLLHLAVPVPSNAKAHVGNLWLQMKQESTNVFDYVWY